MHRISLGREIIWIRNIETQIPLSINLIEWSVTVSGEQFSLKIEPNCNWCNEWKSIKVALNPIGNCSSHWMKASVLSARQCRLWRRAAVKDILFECYIVWNSQCLKKLSEQWDLELFSLGLSSLSVRKEARVDQPAISGAVAARLRLSSLGTIGFYPG